MGLNEKGWHSRTPPLSPVSPLPSSRAHGVLAKLV